MRLPGRTRSIRPTLTLRLRLTVLYGGLLIVAGLSVLALTYVLIDRRLPHSGVFTIQVDNAAGGRDEMVYTASSDPVTDSFSYLRLQQQRLRREALTSILTQGGIALALVGGAAVGIGWFVAGRVLGPLRRVTETARRIAAADAATSRLHERIALRGPHDEVKELADVFDTMVGRLDQSFDSQRRFVANASHELRTPLTVNRVLIELAMHRQSASADVRALGENLLRINGAHERLINGLLLLTRAENPLAQRSPVDLADLVSQVTARSASEAGPAQVDIIEEPGEAVTLGDPVLLDHMVQNLMSNGIRHNLPDGGFVRIASRVRGLDWVEVEVSNSGPAVAAFEVPSLFEPFRRLRADPATADQAVKGAGLGLSIVRSVVQAHGGDVIATPRTDGGLVLTVVLPRHR